MDSEAVNDPSVSNDAILPDTLIDQGRANSIYFPNLTCQTCRGIPDFRALYIGC